MTVDLADHCELVVDLTAHFARECCVGEHPEKTPSES